MKKSEVRKKRKIKENKNKEPGCLFYIWIIWIVIGIIVSQVRNESFFSAEYILSYVIVPPLLYNALIKDGGFIL